MQNLNILIFISIRLSSLCAVPLAFKGVYDTAFVIISIFDRKYSPICLSSSVVFSLIILFLFSLFFRYCSLFFRYFSSLFMSCCVIFFSFFNIYCSSVIIEISFKGIIPKLIRIKTFTSL